MSLRFRSLLFTVGVLVLLAAIVLWMLRPANASRPPKDASSPPAEKRSVYERYNIPRPRNNRGANQLCEIDHLVPLELGGADTIANLWPECSSGYAGWEGASFREKDRFENYLHRQVCSGALSLADAQVEMATDWFRYSVHP